MSITIPFNKPFIVGKELYYIAQSVLDGHTAGDGPFSKRCEALMESTFGAQRVLLTASCTAALEMSAILCDIGVGDEVILPSYTFVSTANAFLLRGAHPRFVDIRPDTLNIDEKQIEAAVSQRTKAIVPVHYAGVACHMDRIRQIAERQRLRIVEDAAQGVNASYKNRFLGTLGDLGAFSFHETKNFICGEGGALAINNPHLIERAEIVREKGTNRSKFFRGQVDKYTWVDIGSSYIPSDLLAAFLYAQLENMEIITERRRHIFNRYYEGLRSLAETGDMRLPFVPLDCQSNYHMFYILLEDNAVRDALIAYLKTHGILSVFHYVPLHLSPMGLKLGYRQGMLPVTEDLSDRLLRLPFYFNLTEAEQDTVINAIQHFFGTALPDPTNRQ